jgi:hypothetical protein
MHARLSLPIAADGPGGQYVSTVSAQTASSTSFCGGASSTPSRVEASTPRALLGHPREEQWNARLCEGLQVLGDGPRADARCHLRRLGTYELHGIAREEDAHLVPLLRRRARDEKGKSSPRRILRSRREMDEDARHG